jgi:quercetin dioxygenase-like cupin family protein
MTFDDAGMRRVMTVPAGPAVTVLSRRSERRPLGVVEHGGRAEAIVWPGMGARWRSMHRIELAPGGRTIRLAHPSDAVYCVASGDAAIIDEDTGERTGLPQGSMVHIEARHPYRLVGSTATEVVGGPCPPDPSLYEEDDHG